MEAHCESGLAIDVVVSRVDIIALSLRVSYQRLSEVFRYHAIEILATSQPEIMSMFER